MCTCNKKSCFLVISKIPLVGESIQNRLPTQSLRYDFTVSRAWGGQEEPLQSAQEKLREDDREVAGTSLTSMWNSKEGDTKFRLLRGNVVTFPRVFYFLYNCFSLGNDVLNLFRLFRHQLEVMCSFPFCMYLENKIISWIKGLVLKAYNPHCVIVTNWVAQHIT